MPDIFVSPEKEPELPVEEPKTEAQKIKLPGHSHNPLAAFCFYPEGVKFETIEKEEKVILLLRQHLIVNVKWILVTLIMLFIPRLAGLFGFFGALPAGFGFVLTLIWYLITVAYAMESFFSWFFNVYIVTNMRIIDIDFYNLIYKQVSDTNLGNVQDLTYNMGGVVRTIFNYGDVFIQTAVEVARW